MSHAIRLCNEVCGVGKLSCKQTPVSFAGCVWCEYIPHDEILKPFLAFNVLQIPHHISLPCDFVSNRVSSSRSREACASIVVPYILYDIKSPGHELCRVSWAFIFVPEPLAWKRRRLFLLTMTRMPRPFTCFPTHALVYRLFCAIRTRRS